MTEMEITTLKEDEEDTLIDMNLREVLERLPETVGLSKPERRYSVNLTQLSFYYVNLLLTTVYLITCVYTFTPLSLFCGEMKE